ncbi:MAG: efflux RND transporter periplasmic adaptor subunit [Alphaproteobacteria bacterium]|nr:efflux RND transporter periplasmic adaptor subunit [Alphaproteobacteria bacterium]MDE2492282.1 efflux RND transporter periplasmic adaptor subunit [Alphaproteobacteria bacterium]
MSEGRTGEWPGRVNAATGGGVLKNLASYFTPRMVRMLLIVGGVLVLIFAYIIGAPIIGFLLMPKGAFVPIQTVSTVRAERMPWQTQIHSVGTLHAVEGADLASEIPGLVTRIGFRPDQDVRKGTLLVQLRDDQDRALLASLRAAAVLAKRTYDRDAVLIKTNAISQTEYDTALANYKGATAQADAQAATVEKKAVRAPYDGRVGIRQVDVGQYVAAGQTLVTLQQLDPIYVDFDVPQQQLALLETGSKVTLTTDAVVGKMFHGEIIAFDPKVDPTTRNAHVRALIHNPGKSLLPGMYATVVTDVGKPRSLITLPQTAMTYNPYGDTVFVIAKSPAAQNPTGKDQLSVEQRFVTVGDTRGDQVSVLSGVKPGEAVVSAGQLKLKNGTLVTINNSVKLPNNPSPTPVEQ